MTRIAPICVQNRLNPIAIGFTDWFFANEKWEVFALLKLHLLHCAQFGAFRIKLTKQSQK